MDKKYGVYICQGCGIGEAVDIEKLSEVAKEEGFPEISVAFKMIAKVEAEHEARYRKLAKNIEDGTVFLKDGKVWWRCRNCGFVYEAKEALDVCPACQHPKAYMELKEDNY